MHFDSNMTYINGFPLDSREVGSKYFIERQTGMKICK